MPGTAGLRLRLEAALGSAYAVERELGGGGMARVFLAEDARLGRRVVVKVLAPTLAADLSAERFEREIRVAARLQHPNVVPVLAAGERAGLAYYTMPYVEGESLRARLDREGRLAADDAASILRDVARALAYAHARGVVHRDVKPDNVLLAGGAAAVADFGIAKALHAARTDGAPPGAGDRGRADALTRAGTLLGTPAYMAPEQAAGDPDVDARADVYAWGVMAYELLAGAHPFAGLAPHQLVRAQLTEAPAPLAARCADCPAALAALVTRCLEKDPARRPQSAAELLAALDAARAPAGPRAAARLRAPRRALLAAAGVAGVVALGAAGWLVARRTRGPAVSAQAIAVAPFRVGGADPALAYLREGMVDLLATKLATGTLARAVDARTLLAAWRGAAGADADLAPARAVDVARAVGAGQLLLGSVVGTPRALTLSAAVIASADQDTVATAEVQGPADSLPALVDRLAARLLTLRAGEGEQRLAAATSTSLAALRPYLEGRALLRRGSFEAAARHFHASLDADSAFALAALGLVDATSWQPPNPSLARGLAALARVGPRLPPRDHARWQVYVASRAEPRRPGRLRVAAERLAALAPDSPEAAFHLGDWTYHFGLLAGVDDADRRAIALFTRALALDSTYAGALEHLPDLYLAAGDVARARAAVARLEALDSAAAGLAGHRFVLAVATGDSAQARALRARLPAMDLLSFGHVFQSSQYATALSPADGARAWEVASARFGAAATGAAVAAARFDWGQPAAAMRALVPAPPPAAAALTIVRHALGEADSAAARAAAAVIAGALDTLPRRLAARTTPLWLLGVHAMARGDTAGARARADDLRRLSTRDDSLGTAAERDGAVLQLETQRAVVERRPDRRALAVRLDSAMQSGMGSPVVDMYSALVLARAWESLGDLPRARAAARRRVRFELDGQQFWAPNLREQARLAELAGDRADAMRAWRRYLHLRADAEPALRADVAAARAALARLERQGAGR
jgi:serine/threonine-protein kinase